jgi:anhydro-N-acetylmuramic acid kinase
MSATLPASGPIWALGTMSGTSLDGVDAAMVLTDGVTVREFGPHAFRPYTSSEQATLRAALGLWPGDRRVTQAAAVVENAHAELLSRFKGAQVVGFHGQTLAHDPAGRGTHQAGDGDVLAAALDTAVVWDFRANDVAMGGQGAPLAPFFHHALARRAGITGPVAFLNLGGVGNISWVDPRIADPDAPGALLAFDTGPANAPLNDLMLSRKGEAQDRGGELAARGWVDEAVVNRLMADGWFLKVPPKSLDRNAFHGLLEAARHLSDADAAATVTAAVAACVARAGEHFPAPVEAVLVTGGGRHNGTLMAELARRTGARIRPVEELGLNGDMLEAQAFAFLAVRVLRGMTTSAPGTTGVAAAIGGGRIARPDE